MQLNHYQRNFGEKYAQSLPTLGQAMVDILRFFKVERIYGVGGDFAANIISALSSSLQVLPAGNEMHAGFTACGQAEIEGLGVCLTTYTVGSLPCTSAAALAKTEKLPVVFISGAPGEQEIGETALHHTVSSCATWHKEYDAALDAFKALGIRAERLQGERNPRQPNVAAEQFFRLVKHAYMNEEPVFVEVPRDLLNAKTQGLALPASTAELTRQEYILKGAEQIVEHIIAKLKAAQKPLLYLGVQSKLNKPLLDKIAQFCGKFNIPYTTSWFAKGVFDDFSPLSLGAYNGAFSTEFERHYIEHQVDYVLEVGTSINPLDTDTAFNTGTHKLHSFDNKTSIKATTQKQNDLLAIFDLLLAADIPPFDYVAPKRINHTLKPNDKLDFHNLCATLNELQTQAHNSFIYFPEIGNSYFASFGLQTKTSSLHRSWLCNPWYAAMGTSLPYARAAAEVLKQNNADDIAVVITGDGGFNFQSNELIHFLRAKLNVLIIYMRNDIFHLGKSGEAPIYHCSDKSFDVKLLVQAYGGKAEKCTTVEQFNQAFKAFTKLEGIKLIEVPASTEEQYQCQQIALLNLYIKAQNGDQQSVEQWRTICQQ